MMAGHSRLENLFGMESAIAKHLIEFRNTNQLTNTELLQLLVRFNASCAAWSMKELLDKKDDKHD